MILLAAAISIAVQVVGVLLIFALMVTPAAIAQQIARRPMQGIASLSLSLCLQHGLDFLFHSICLTRSVSL